jgi:PadR family transcriptional regulator PadR
MPDRQATTATNAMPDGTDRTPGAGAPRNGRPERGPDAGTTAADAREPGADGPTEPTDEREPMPGWAPRDILTPFVLLAVSLQRAHGYVIEDYLRALGLFGITMSTLYRTLRQMEKDGFLESTWEPGPTGPARRVYTITDAGHVWLESSAATLNAYRETIDRFFGLYDAGPGASRRQPTEPTDEKEMQE